MKNIVLTFDDACRNHLETVAPLLKDFGFNATFFICRFTEKWRSEHSQYQMTAKEIRALDEMGFEIGNHSWNHPDLRKLDNVSVEREINDLTQFLTDAGISKPVSFAYPGGPYAENAAPILRRKGFRFARTTEKRAWNLKTDDPLKVPAFAANAADDKLFMEALRYASEETPVVLVYHGIPEYVHPWCNTPPEVFRKEMEYLKTGGFRVISFRDLES